MSEETKKNIWWYLKTAGEAVLWTGAYYGTELLQLFPEHTVAHKIALPAGFALGFLVRKILGIRKEYQQKTKELPGGVERAMDKIPDKITGEKNSK